jgi:hypothetical protein
MSGLRRTLRTLGRMYDANPEVLCVADMMREKRYADIFRGALVRLRGPALDQAVPEHRRGSDGARTYTVHEITCTLRLSEEGYDCKIGPRAERPIDALVRELDPGMRFAYLADALALGTRTPDAVAPYLASSRGPNNGQRLVLDGHSLLGGYEEHRVRAKILCSCEEAQRALATLASVSGMLRGESVPAPEEIGRLGGRALRHAATKLVLEQITRPYSAAMR